MISDFCDYINDSIRILILLNNSKSRKSLKMDDYKIKLYDYYLKFPYTMIGVDSKIYGFEENIDEYYSFFHWQPDLIKYRQALNYLISKKFIIEDNKSNYKITEIGEEVLQKINNDYFIRLNGLCSEFVIPKVSKLSNKKIEENIRLKANIISLRGLIKNDND